MDTWKEEKGIRSRPNWGPDSVRGGKEYTSFKGGMPGGKSYMKKGNHAALN